MQSRRDGNCPSALLSCPSACPVNVIKGRLQEPVYLWKKILLSLNLYVLLDKLLEGIEN